MAHDEKQRLVEYACDRLDIARCAIRTAIRDVSIALGPYGHTAELEVIEGMLRDIQENFKCKLERGEYDYQFKRSKDL